MHWDYVLALKTFAALTALLAIVDRVWFANDRTGRWHRLGGPWRRFACVTREAAHNLARRFWCEHPIRPHDSRRPEDSEDRLAGGIFYTLVWLCVLFLNYAVVAQILDIFIPSSDIVRMPFVGEVGQAAVAAAPIVIVLEMVAGILVHMTWTNGRWDVLSVFGKLGALVFALAWVVLEGLGSWYRGIIAGGVVLADAAATKQAAAILSAVIGSVVPIAEMYTGARAWDMFIPRFIVSVFYRVQALGLWIVTGWLHLIAGARQLRIHTSVTALDEDAFLLSADAERTDQGIAGLKLELSRYNDRRESVELMVRDLDHAGVNADGVERDKAQVLALVKQLEDWLADFERSTESLSAFAAARRLEVDGLCPLRIVLPEVRDSNPKLCEGLAVEAVKKVDAWINEVVDDENGPLTRCIAKADGYIDEIEAPVRSIAEFSQQLDAFRARAVSEKTRLEQHEERLAHCAHEAREWKTAVALASGAPDSATPTFDADDLANPSRSRPDSIDLKLRTLREEGFTEAKELNANAERLDGVLTRLGELRQKLGSASADVNELVSEADRLIDCAKDLQRRCADRRRELNLDAVVERCAACKAELETKRRYLCGSTDICLRPILRGLLSQWLAHVRIRGQHVTDAVILAREPISEEDRRNAGARLVELFDQSDDENKR